MANLGTTSFDGLQVDGYAFPKVITGTIAYNNFGTTSATGVDMGTPLATAVYHTAAKQPIATLTAGSLIGGTAGWRL